MKIGVDYYPEQWPESMWEPDADRMKETGVRIVRLAEFAWSRLEPTEGQYDFEWLDRVITLFAERGIEVILGTPTCTPPQWMFYRYPEIIAVDALGRRVKTGIRGHRCVNSPVFRDFCRRMITRMATRYRDWDAVTGYQIDNELEANHCRCAVCRERFRDWVQRKYKTAEAVNRAYGNAVWSGEYSDLREIEPPMGESLLWMNPSLHLDYQKYASDSVIEYARCQAEWIRQSDPGAKITTNTWLCEHMPDFYDLFADLDFVSYDNYPAASLPKDARELYSHAFHLDLMRGIRKKPFWVMEQLSGIVGSWAPMGRTPQPGMVKGYALQALAHGADVVLHFRWRTAKAGAEMYWQGILDPSGLPGRRYREFADLCQTVNRWPKLDGAMPRNKVAVLYSTVQEYAFRIQYQAEGMYYLEFLKSWHDAFTCLGLGVDVIAWDAPLESYDIVVAPNLLITDQQVADHLYAYTSHGGTLLLTNRCGVKDANNQFVSEPIPSVYRDLTGITVAEYDPLGEAVNTLKIQDAVWARQLEKWRIRLEDRPETTEMAGNRTVCTRWCDLLEKYSDDTEILAVYDGEFYQGTAAVVRHPYGMGRCYYIGTGLRREAYIALAEKIVQERGMTYYPDLPIGVELTERFGETGGFRFWFNNTGRRQNIPQENRILEPFEMLITQVEPNNA